MGMNFRAGTWDLEIYNCIAIRNEYELPNKLNKSDIIIDIGAHIGSFSRVCLNKGAGTVVSFEPHPENFKMCLDNVPEATVYNLAVSGDNNPVSIQVDFPGPNTGGDATCLGLVPGKYLIPSITLDEIVKEFDSVSIVKMDCEGAEFNILLNFTSFNKVKKFVGEYHLGQDWDVKILKNLFKANGFDIKFEESRETDKLGHFWAWQNIS